MYTARMTHIQLFFCCFWLVLSNVYAHELYNLVSSQDVETFKQCTVPCAVHVFTRQPQEKKTLLNKDYRLKEFLANFMEAGKYLEDFEVKFASIDCYNDPVEELCSKESAKTTIFVYRYGHILTELPMDALYNVDSIISNMLHLVLLREVPFVQEPIDLAAMQQKAKRHKDIMFAKVIAVGTPEHRAFMEGAFAYSHLYQFVMTTNSHHSMLGIGTDAEWSEAQNRVWFLNCKVASSGDVCQRSFYRGKLNVPDFALYLKTLDVLPYVEYKATTESIFYQRLSIPTAYVYSSNAQYPEHKAIVQDLSQTYKGNLGFVLINSDITTKSVISDDINPCQHPCLMLQRAPKENVITMIGDLTVKSVSSFIEDNMYIQVEPSDEQNENEENEGNKQIPVQEIQDDEVQFAVNRDTRVLDMSHVPKLTDKTFPELIARSQLVVILFTVRWDPRCKAFLESYSSAAKTIQEANPQLSQPLTQVECFSWPDVCQLNNVTTYPAVKMYKEGKMVADYKGSLSKEGILKAYHLYSTSNPVILETCSDCAAFSSGQQPEWVQSTLTAVVMGYFPATAIKERREYEQAAKVFQGQHLMAVCQAECPKLQSGASKPSVTAFKWVDSHQPQVEYTGDYTARDLITFVHKATLPIVPELTPSTFPLHFSQGKPFLILFKDTDDQSIQAESSLATLALEKTFESKLTILWIDVSQPSCVGSEILKDYGIRRQRLHPSVVFVDHSTSRVCNYPPDFSYQVPAMTDWLKIVMNGETTCSGLKEGKFEPLVSPYDFLALVNSKKDMVSHRLSRLPTDHRNYENGEELEDGARDLYPQNQIHSHQHTEL
ncbi:thioredoxin domain-containing protein 16-like [Asterias amurensis]|uniref:thioredoxin domain-containing protein 16-like n=1 Tax=Asterias amurensis TaxID=7602 RepID=UPI003AB3D9F7